MMSSHAFGHATPGTRGRRFSHVGSSVQAPKRVPLSALLQSLSEGGSLFKNIYYYKDLNQQSMCVMIRRNLLNK